MLSRVQRGLESLYRIETCLLVEDFLITADERDGAGVARSPREQLLLREDDDGLALGLFVDVEIVEALSGLGADDLLRAEHLGDFLLLLEGVSHFVYVAHRAQADRSVSALELELQAEVDKYVTCLLSGPCVSRSPALRRRLFEDVEYLDDLDARELERYRTANDNAMRYAGSLESRFVTAGRVVDMLVELRIFYRMSLSDKLSHIAQAA